MVGVFSYDPNDSKLRRLDSQLPESDLSGLFLLLGRLASFDICEQPFYFLCRDSLESHNPRNCIVMIIVVVSCAIGSPRPSELAYDIVSKRM